jgi:hypothetical protein
VLNKFTGHSIKETQEEEEEEEEEEEKPGGGKTWYRYNDFPKIITENSKKQHSGTELANI